MGYQGGDLGRPMYYVHTTVETEESGHAKKDVQGSSLVHDLHQNISHHDHDLHQNDDHRHHHQKTGHHYTARNVHGQNHPMNKVKKNGLMKEKNAPTDEKVWMIVWWQCVMLQE